MLLPDKYALIVVDVQNDFVSGTMAVPNAKSIVDPINGLANIFSTVVVVTDWHPVGHVSFASSHNGKRHGDTVQTHYGEQRVFHDHCVQGTWGAELDSDLRLEKAQLVLRKGYRMAVESNGAFYENDGVTRTGLTGYLRARGIERVYCAGLARFGCVMETATGAARDGFEVRMVDDACTGSPSINDDASLKRLVNAGVTWVHSCDLMDAARRVTG